ncbi:MAG: hypothetical protein ACD_21C00169G0001 [uncultured bacterium]|nr:MAG: hypothetical protein ACD_21C00169G0001 [uncultured bacterium]
MKKLFLHLLFLTIVSTAAQARWASFEDAPIKVSLQNKITVNSDGTTKELKTVQFEILKEPGRNLAANYALQYNGVSTKIKILEAKTIYKGKEYKLDKNLIEDKPLASAHNGFDQMRQVLLAFPKAEIGAKIFLKYDVITSEVPLDKFYASVFYFGDGEFLDKARIKLHSQIPLHLLINDPQRTLNITKDAADNLHNLEITLIKPIYKGVIDEPHSNVLNDKYLTWVSVSSLNNWQDLATRWSQQYAKVLTQSLPKDFEQIAILAEQKKDEVDQINTVTALLNNRIQYLGDWRTIKGAFIPRSLDKINQTQLGDCKDFSAATAAILTRLGYKAQIILARRGRGNFYPDSLPDYAAFNHALLKVTSKQGKVYWIDPTNFQSMANGIFPDIADKNALILDLKQPNYEKIANIAPTHPQAIQYRQIEVIDDNKIVETGKITLKNEEAYELTGAALITSEERIKNILFDQLSRTRLEETNKKYLHLPDLKSRIVKDITFDYCFEQENRVLKTNLGQALKLTYDRLIGFFDVAQNHVKDVLLDTPFTLTRQTIIKNITVQNIDSLNKEIKTPWLYVARKCTYNNHDLQIDDTVIVHKNLITNEELKTPEFIKLKDDLEKNFKDVAVVFTKSK